MAFKMKNPGMGKIAKAAGSPAKFGIEHKGIDSAARGTKAIGSDGQPLKMKKDFGMEGSAMKFKGIRDKIAARKARKLQSAKDPDAKGIQNIAETGVVSDRSQGSGRLKEVQVDTKGDVKSMKKEKVRGRDVVKKDGTVKKKGRRITKEFDAEGSKVKKVYDSDGNLLKEKTSKTRKLDKKNIGKAAEQKVATRRKEDDAKIEKINKPIREANEKTTVENKQITINNAAKFAAEEPKYNAWRDKQIADGATNVPTFAEAHKARTEATDAPAPTTMKRKSAMKMKRKSALKKDDKKKSDGGSIEATVTIPGTKGDKIEQSETPEQKAAYAKYLKNETPEQKERRLKRESGGKDAETRTYKSDYTYDKEKPLTPEQKAKREEGKFNTLKVKKKRKKRRGGGSSTEGITLRDKIRNTFRKKQKPKMCP